jgi:hypothetical protein
MIMTEILKALKLSNKIWKILYFSIFKNIKRSAELLVVLMIIFSLYDNAYGGEVRNNVDNVLDESRRLFENKDYVNSEALAAYVLKTTTGSSEDSDRINYAESLTLIGKNEWMQKGSLDHKMDVVLPKMIDSWSIVDNMLIRNNTVIRYNYKRLVGVDVNDLAFVCLIYGLKNDVDNLRVWMEKWYEATKRDDYLKLLEYSFNKLRDVDDKGKRDIIINNIEKEVLGLKGLISDDYAKEIIEDSLRYHDLSYAKSSDVVSHDWDDEYRLWNTSKSDIEKYLAMSKYWNLRYENDCLIVSFEILKALGNVEVERHLKSYIYCCDDLSLRYDKLMNAVENDELDKAVFIQMKEGKKQWHDYVSELKKIYYGEKINTKRSYRWQFSYLLDDGYYKMINMDYEGAIVDFNKEMALYPKSVYAYMYRGMARGLLMDYNGMRQDLSKASQMDRDNYLSYIGLIKMCMEKPDDIKDILTVLGIVDKNSRAVNDGANFIENLLDGGSDMRKKLGLP